MVATEFRRPTGRPTPRGSPPSPGTASTEGRLILMNAGTFGNVLRWMPPLVVTEAEIDLALEAFAKAMVATAGRHSGSAASPRTASPTLRGGHDEQAARTSGSTSPRRIPRWGHPATPCSAWSTRRCHRAPACCPGLAAWAWAARPVTSPAASTVPVRSP